MSKVEEKGEDTSPQDKRSDYWSIGLPADAIVTRTSDRPIKEIPEDISPIWLDAMLRLAGFAESFSTIVPVDYMITQKELAELTEEQKEARLKLFQQLSAETDEAMEQDPAKLFEMQCEKAKLKDPYFNRTVFAEMEKMRARAAFGKYEMLPDLHDLYTENPAYLLVRRYIGYLDEILGQKQLEGSTVDSDVQPTDWDVTDLEKLFDRCRKEGLTLREEKKRFISMFTTGFTGPVTWHDKKVWGARTALFYIMFQITKKVYLPSELNALFTTDVKLSPHNCTLNDGKKPHSILGKRLCAGIKGGT